MPLTLTIPRAFDPAYSLLGRVLLRRASDARHAAAWVYAGTTLAVLGALLAHFAAWPFVAPAVEAAPLGAVAVGFFVFQALSLLAIVGVGLAGVRPAAHVRCAEGRIEVRQGGAYLTLPLSAIERAEVVDPVTFHRHHARWAETRAFLAPRPCEMLLLWDARAPLALGLTPADRAALLAYLARHGVDVRVPTFTAQVA